jgi:sulfur carrier protein ThiS
MAPSADADREDSGRETIAVTVNLMADLRRFLPPGVDGPHRHQVPAGSTVLDLLAMIGIPKEAELTVGLDGELATRDALLRDGALVLLVGPMEGGAA